jgi:predicted permease
MLTELRQATRRLLASPGYGLGVFLTLAVGLALSVGMYTVLNGVILNGLPYPGGERVVEITGRNDRQDEIGTPLTAAEALAIEDSPVFEQAGWFIWGGMTVWDGERPREITVNHVSADFFAALGVPPRVGRWIGADDLGKEPRAVVLSDREWDRLANRDPGIVGQPLELVNGTVIVIGVMPPEFAFPAGDVGLWHAADPGRMGSADDFVNARYLHGVGKLAAGTGAERAALELEALAAQLRGTHGLADSGWRLQTISLLDQAVGDVRGVLAGVFVVSLVVLAIACANVGSLLAARLAAREHELAILQALGATSSRVWRGLLLELLLLALLSSLAALLLLVVGLEAFRAFAAGILPRAEDIVLDPTVPVFAAGAALLCSLAIAVPFGLRLRRRMAGNLRASGKGGGARGGTLQALPVTGLAMATTALIAGAAVLLSLERLRAVDPGFRVGEMYAVQVFHGGGPEEWRRFAEAVRNRMAALPGVAGVAMTTVPPLANMGNFVVDVQVPGREQPGSLQTALHRVSADYLSVLEQPLVAGRDFASTDNAAAAKVAIVNDAFARRVFGGIDVIGRHIELPLGNGPREPFRIVGVAAATRNAGLRNPPDPEILVPFVQAPWVGMTFLAKAPQAGDGLLSRLQEAVWQVDPREAITRASRLEDDLDAQLALIIFFTRLLGGFALLALLLAAFGTYSVIAFLQRRQTRETGVRLALGAEPTAVAGRVLRQGAALALIAGLAGSLAAIAVLRLLGTQLFGIGATSPALYAVGVGGVLLAALLASVMPALRALRVNPMEALRYE